MKISPKATVELFHLVFLRLFNQQITPGFYAIKGGCNLRFFFNSIRYSEDLDIDIKTIQTSTLKNKVDKIFFSSALTRILQSYGLEKIDTHSPKQTSTTQRWKINIYGKNLTLPLHTKIEFSRRNNEFESEFDNVSLQICQPYQLSPIRLHHYNLNDALRQKILALAHRKLTQSRDVFDIYHLLHREKITPLELSRRDIDTAKEALSSIRYEDFKSQVVSFLEPEQQSTFNDKKSWESISSEVWHYLESYTQ